MTKEQDLKVVATNRKAYHDYSIEQQYEAGIALTGTEIKSVRSGLVNLRDSYVQVAAGQAWLINAHIAPYDHASWDNHDPRRDRRLLLHKKEILKLNRLVQEKGFTIVPLRMYLKGNKAKVEIALARGKRLYDKREAIADRDSRRQVERELRDRQRERAADE